MRLGASAPSAALIRLMMIMASLATIAAAHNPQAATAEHSHPGKTLQQIVEHLTATTQEAPRMIRTLEKHAVDMHAQERRALINIMYSVSQKTDACTGFKSGFLGLLYKNGDTTAGFAEYPAGCGYQDSFSIPTDPANNLTWFTKICTYEGANSATKCGATGFFAKARTISMQYSGRLPASCALGDIQAKDILKVLNLLTAFYCSSDGTKFCYPEYKTSIDSIQGMSFNTSAPYPKLCTACTKLVWDNLALAFQDDPSMEDTVRFMDFLCLNLENKWCYLEYMNSAGDPAKMTGAVYCTSQCLRRASNKYYLITAHEMSKRNLTLADLEYGAGMTFALTDAWCMKTASNQYCADTINTTTYAPYPALVSDSSCAAPVSGAATVPMPAAPTTCNAQCKTDIQAVLTAWGCCAASFGTSKIGISDKWLPYWTALTTVCGMPDPVGNTCQKGSWSRPVEFCLPMPNLKYSFYTTYKDKIDTELCFSELPDILPITPSTCSVIGATEIDGPSSTKGTKPCFRIMTGSQDQAEWLTKVITSSSRRQSLRLYALKKMSSLPGESRNVATNVVGAALEIIVKTTTAAATTAAPSVPTTTPAPVGTYATFTATLPMTKADFTDAKQKDFKDAVAAAAKVDVSTVTITNIKELTARRRLLATSISVDFSILVTGAATVDSLRKTLTPDALNTELAKKSLPKATLTGSMSAGSMTVPSLVITLMSLALSVCLTRQ